MAEVEPLGGARSLQSGGRHFDGSGALVVQVMVLAVAFARRCFRFICILHLGLEGV